MFKNGEPFLNVHAYSSIQLPYGLNLAHFKMNLSGERGKEGRGRGE